MWTCQDHVEWVLVESLCYNERGPGPWFESPPTPKGFHVFTILYASSNLIQVIVGFKLGFCMVKAVPVVLKRALGSYVSKEKKNIRHSTGRQQQWAPITIAFSALGYFEAWVIHKKILIFCSAFYSKTCCKGYFLFFWLHYLKKGKHTWGVSAPQAKIEHVLCPISKLLIIFCKLIWLSWSKLSEKLKNGIKIIGQALLELLIKTCKIWFWSITQELFDHQKS